MISIISFVLCLIIIGILYRNMIGGLVWATSEWQSVYPTIVAVLLLLVLILLGQSFFLCDVTAADPAA